MSIKIKNVTYTYMKKTPYEKNALQDVNLEIEKGSFVAVAGHTGSGKSTLMQHLNGLLRPTIGKVEVDGIDINKDKDKVRARRMVGMVFQYPETQLFEESIYKDIAFGPKNFGCTQEEITTRVKRAMAFVNLNYKKYKDVSPFMLSGGQMRRAAIAGIIALQPDYLVMDEPTAGLDPKAKRDLLQNIKALYKEGKTTIIMVSHNMDDIIDMAQRIVILRDGKITADGEPKDVFQHSDILRQAGLHAPHLTQLLQKIKQQALPIKADSTTIAQAADNICTQYRRREKNVQ